MAKSALPKDARWDHLPTRREVLCVGGLTTLSVTLPQVLAPTSRVMAAPNHLSREMGATFGRAKNCIFLWLQGGPPQHETFDPKPAAPVDIRGPFRPIATTVPGVHFCELLPRTARHAHQLAIVRSLATRDDNHDVSGYWLLTGYPYGPGSARQIKPTDWPYFGSIVKMLRPSQKMPALTSVWIPDVMRLNDNVQPAGQTAGFLGKLWEPERFVGDPASLEYHIDGLGIHGDMTKDRLENRRLLLEQMNRAPMGDTGDAGKAWDRLSAQAFDLITSGAARAAFDLTKESDRTRDRYGRYTWGQSCLLARRLIEAGVRLVHVNWPREPGDSAVDNPLWDTHAQNADRLQDCLCPMFDVTFDALMTDLEERGLLAETLVVVVGEFGRTPRINQVGGRDHWGHCFCAAFAGAGIRGGTVVGASDKNGAYPISEPITGSDFAATLFHLLGIDPGGMFYDKANRPHPICKGQPIVGILGDPQPIQLRVPEGDVSLVPPYDTRLLLDTDFASTKSLLACSPPSREKGWRAWPLEGHFQVFKEKEGIFIGWRTDGTIAEGETAVLSQEIRNARGGNYTFSVEATGVADHLDLFERNFSGHFECRLSLIRYRDMKKDPREAVDLGSTVFQPVWGKKKTFIVDRFLGSRGGGNNFPIGNGLGVLLTIRKKSPGSLQTPGRAGLLVHAVQIEFSPVPRDDTNDLL